MNYCEANEPVVRDPGPAMVDLVQETTKIQAETLICIEQMWQLLAGEPIKAPDPREERCLMDTVRVIAERAKQIYCAVDAIRARIGA